MKFGGREQDGMPDSGVHTDDGPDTAAGHELRPLAGGVVLALDPDVGLVGLAGDLSRIGYPVWGVEATPGTA
ncbi:hypothetical protein SRB5_70360 [Streptomyces sp. RB5]|uniref:Uncharacterized protein n=1 Tax=Streptomyces smaragdinus TaxID=2585196 RepID=A0A7K0CTZ4_9ACTN|nr:hypothetical protein [Streptomyces smaragdinus]MQY16833.1 hypothetical protein [Streptomyces smaragdinus]